MEEFSWSKINLCFPEYFEHPLHDKELFLGEYPFTPKFYLSSVSFRLNKEYGIQLFSNKEIPDLLKDKDTKVNGKNIEEFYLDSFKEVYNIVLKELNNSLETFESWRPFISKYDGNEWKGNLQDHIEFVNQNNEIKHFDYYRLNGRSPTDKLIKIGKIPKEALNKKFLKYYEISQNVLYGGEGKCNSITGKTLTECIKNADKIYRMAPELKELGI